MFFVIDLLMMPYLNPSFCLNTLNSKNVYYVIFVGLLLDFIIADLNGKITLIFLTLFLINKRIKNYYVKNLFNFVIFYALIYPFVFNVFIFSLLFYFLLITILKNA